MLKRRKYLILILIISLTLSIICLGINHMGWKTIRINGFGKFRVPSDWVYLEENERIYFTDNEGDLIMGEWRYSDDVYIGYENYIEGIAYSNSAAWSKHSLEINGVQGEFFCLDFDTHNGKSIKFIVYDKTVSKNTVDRIAKSLQHGTGDTEGWDG